MTDYALPRVRARRKSRKPWSPWTKIYFALAVLFVIYTFMDWTELFAGHVLFPINNWPDVQRRNIDGGDVLAAGLDPALAALYWHLFKRSRKSDQQ